MAKFDMAKVESQATLKKQKKNKKNKIVKNNMSSEEVKETKMVLPPSSESNEQLKVDLEMLFTYARCHSANINPQNENELIHIINLKTKVFSMLKL